MTRQDAVEMVKTIPDQIPSPNKISFIIVWATMFVLSVMYAYFVNQTVMNIVERKSVEKEIASLESMVGDLEFEFIAQKNTINLDYAYARGFEDIVDTRYITRLADTNKVTLETISYEEIQ